MSRLLFFLALAFAFVGCQSAPTVTVPTLPDWPSEPSATWSQAQVIAGITAVAPGARVDLSDSTYTAADHATMLRLVAWSREFAHATAFRYVPESLDCEKFAKALSLAAEMSAARAGIRAQPLVARIYVRQIEPWAGTPAGGHHAINAFLSDRGLYVLEPQNGEIAPLATYPNRHYIYSVRIGG